MKLTTSKGSQRQLKPISNVFKLKNMIQKAANSRGVEDKQNVQTNIQRVDSCSRNPNRFPKLHKSGEFLITKQRIKSEAVDGQASSSCSKINSLNFNKLKINPVSSSHKLSSNICISQTDSTDKGKNSPLKKIQGLGKSYRSPFCPKGDITIDSFNIGTKLGRGRFGNVYAAQEKHTNFILALKMIDKKQLKQSQMEQQLLSEIKLQTYMKHPNILQMYGFFHDQTTIYLMLELAQQCLFKDLRRKTSFPQRTACYFIKQIVEGLKYMHSESIIHRDLKPQNIMVINNVIKLADFGWSVYSPLYKRQTFCGTLDYVPPEIVKGDYYDERVDVWSLGILIYELSFGFAPFQGNHSQEETFERILNGDFQIPQYVSDDLKRLIKYILIKDPKLRLNLKDIEQCNWFRVYEKQGRCISEDIWNFWESHRSH